MKMSSSETPIGFQWCSPIKRRSVRSYSIRRSEEQDARIRACGISDVRNLSSHRLALQSSPEPKCPHSALLMSGNFQEVVLNGAVEKKHLVESLHNRDKMRACAIFLLTIDSRSYEYWLVLGAEYQETMATEFISKEFNSMLPTAANSNIEARISWTIKVMGEGTAISRERKWALGLHLFKAFDAYAVFSVFFVIKGNKLIPH
ncbi:uncharacterized protein A4U43_C08F13050 [Asparagus officinalis]|nr:uncharacterized protein A4U43_C08F13050 [Asparagus officinalis]